MSSTLRTAGVALACLAALTLAGCGGGGGPAAKIGDLSIGKYVALGDGYAAAPYSGPTERQSGCRRSAASYPALLADEVGAKDFVDATCTFARTQDLRRATRPPGADERVPAQLDLVTADTDLVTLTVGLSDRRLARRMLEACVAPCEDEDGVPVNELGVDLGRISTSVGDALADVVEKAPSARVVVVGYPTLFPAEGDCKAMPDMSQEQTDLVNALMKQLNKGLQSAARGTGADFLDAAELSSGHDMCAGEPWVKGADAGPDEVPRFHPFKALNETIASRLADDLKP